MRVKYQTVEITIPASRPAGTYEYSATLDSAYDRCTGIICLDASGYDTTQIGLSDNEETILDLCGRTLFVIDDEHHGKSKFMDLNFPIRNGQNLQIKNKYESDIAGGLDKYSTYVFRLEKDEDGTESVYNSEIKIQTLDFTLSSGKSASTYDYPIAFNSKFKKVKGIWLHNITTGSLSFYRSTIGIVDSGKILVHPVPVEMLETEQPVNPNDKWLPVDFDIHNGMNTNVRLITKESPGSDFRSIIHFLLEK